MKFNISSKNLESHLSAVSKVVNSKNSISILDNFLFELSGDELVITGSDSDNTLKTRLMVNDAEGSGKFVVYVKRLNELTSLFTRRIKPSRLYQIYILIQTMCNLGDFLNSIRLMSADRTTMPIRIEENGV